MVDESAETSESQMVATKVGEWAGQWAERLEQPRVVGTDASMVDSMAAS